jgi:hypothetical protein
MATTDPTTRGRGWAYTGALLGGAVSIAANVAHSYVPPAGAPTDWAPQPGAVIGSIFWPVFLFIAVEILARVVWPHGTWWAMLRFGGLLPIAVVAGLVSYRHLSALLTYYGEDPLTAVIGPIAVDGLMVMATGALIVTGRHLTTKTAPTVTTTVPVEPDAHAPHTLATTHGHHPVIPIPTTDPVTPAVASLPTHLLPSARFAATRHANTTGQTITADELATAINIPADTARQLLPAVTEQASMLVGTINGTPVGAR